MNKYNNLLQREMTNLYSCPFALALMNQPAVFAINDIVAINVMTNTKIILFIFTLRAKWLLQQE